MDKYVVVLNVNHQPIQYVTLIHAIKMINRGVVSVHESVPEKNFGKFPYPKVVKLVKYIYESWKYSRKPGWSRKKVLIRDKRACGYCGEYATTIDHIKPLSRGGESSWLNTIASCKPCNSKKSSKLLSQSGLTLINKPFEPTYEHVNKYLYSIYGFNESN